MSRDQHTIQDPTDQHPDSLPAEQIEHPGLESEMRHAHDVGEDFGPAELAPVYVSSPPRDQATSTARSSAPPAASRSPRLPRSSRHRLAPRRLPVFLLGVGLGGFVDGIVLHQILQWHHMLTGDNGGESPNTVAGLETNTLVDGFFHLVTWIIVVVATTMLVNAWQRRELAPPWRVHVGLLLVGWGAFNVVEGLINHQILGIHHVRDDLGAPLGWDIGFLALGVALIVAGSALLRSGERLAALDDVASR